MPQLNKYLKHHELHQHINSVKNDKVKVIARHWLPQMNPEGPDPLMLQTRLRERDWADKESLEDSGSDEDEYSRSENDDNDKNDNDSINSGGEDVILAFIDDEEEVERPATTLSGRSINRKLTFLSFDSLYFFMFEK